jgi:hypothetical protein
MTEPEPSRRGPLAAMVLIAVLLFGGLWLQRHLRENSILQDCVMAGRKNCAPVTSG